MKATTILPVSLLFLRLATSVPITLPLPLTSPSFPPDCAYKTCHPSLLRVLSSSVHPNTPSTKLSTHQQAYPSTIEEEEALKDSPITPPPFDNLVITPSSDVLPSIALKSSQPLESAYLQSLSDGVAISTEKDEEGDESADSLPSMSTSALPSLRKADMQIYWPSQHQSQSAGGAKDSDSWKNCGGNMILPGNIYIKSHNMSRGSDILVVGIVVLFLAIVVAVEGAEKIWEFKNCIFNTHPSPRHGPIHLASSSTASSPLKQPLHVQSFPSTPFPSANTPKESFYYDSDVNKQV